MNQRFFVISPSLEEEDSCIGDWEFTYWNNKPKGEVIRNPNGTFSVKMEEGFIPLVEQLQNLFKNGKIPESGTYLGEAVLRGVTKPNDLIGGTDFLKANGLFISDKLLTVFNEFHLPNNTYYKIPLIHWRKCYDSYGYINFSKESNDDSLDVKFIMVKRWIELCVSESLKKEIENRNMVGCKFELVKQEI